MKPMISTLAWITLPLALFGYGAWSIAVFFSNLPGVPLESLLQGTAAQTIETRHREVMPLRDRASDVFGASRYVLFRDARSGTVVGERNWLFTAEEFRATDALSEVLEQRIATIVSIGDAWAERGTSLVVVPLPAKADIERHAHPFGEIALARHRDYERFVGTLTEQGIEAVDVREAFALAGPGAFFAQDTHWRPATTLRVAEKIRASGLIDPGDKEFARVDGGTRENLGDLTTYVTSMALAGSVGLRAEEFTPFYAQEVEASLDLFESADPASLVLVGTSYSANPDWSFAEALRLLLKQDVENHAAEGLGPLQPMLTLLDSTAPAPETVIWEVPIRYLTDPDVWHTEKGNDPHA